MERAMHAHQINLVAWAANGFVQGDVRGGGGAGNGARRSMCARRHGSCQKRSEARLATEVAMVVRRRQRVGVMAVAAVQPRRQRGGGDDDRLSSNEFPLRQQTMHKIPGR